MGCHVVKCLLGALEVLPREIRILKFHLVIRQVRIIHIYNLARRKVMLVGCGLAIAVLGDSAAGVPSATERSWKLEVLLPIDTIGSVILSKCVAGFSAGRCVGWSVEGWSPLAGFVRIERPRALQRC